MTTNTKKSGMIYRRLGETGLKVSAICLGCMSFGDSKNWMPWVMEKDDGVKLVEKAWKAGINFFDTANVYSQGRSEEILGFAIEHLGIPRDEIVIATKLFAPMVKKEPLNDGNKAIKNTITVNNSGLCRKAIFEQCEASLKRLKTNYIDLYQIHRWDPETPIEETMKALHDLVQSGKVHYIGASTMYAWQFAKAQHVAMKNGWTPFVSMQNFYNLVYREEEREMMPMCYDMGVGVIPWSPLMRGYLARRRDQDDAQSVRFQAESKNPRTKQLFEQADSTQRDIREVVRTIAEERKVSPSEVAIAWVLSKPFVSSAIVGVSKPEQLDDAINSVNFTLTEKEISRLEAPYTPRRLMGGFTGKSRL